MKTLYITDLDGTLLNPELKISDYTAKTINGLIEKGLIFSYATARSSYTALPLTKAINTGFPIVVHNGVFIVNNDNREKLLENYFTQEAYYEIMKVSDLHGASPIVYSIINGGEKFSYIQDRVNKATKKFAEGREKGHNDPRPNPVSNMAGIQCDKVYYFTFIDSEEKLKPMLKRLETSYNCIYSKDIYSGDIFLEIMPKGVTKASGVKQLKKILGCDRIVAFGDNRNDIPMFQLADECYAVENATDELKAIATAVIGSNAQDGVAKWLLENADI